MRAAAAARHCREIAAVLLSKLPCGRPASLVSINKKERIPVLRESAPFVLSVYGISRVASAPYVTVWRLAHRAFLYGA